MTWDKMIGPATIVYLISATVAALWWASDLNRRVVTVEQSTVTAERMARMEQRLDGVNEKLTDIKDILRTPINERRAGP